MLQDEKPGVPKRLKRIAQKCSYTDGVADGTVTVLGPLSGHAQLTLKPSATSTTRSPGAPQPGQRSTVPAPR